MSYEEMMMDISKILVSYDSGEGGVSVKQLASELADQYGVSVSIPDDVDDVELIMLFTDSSVLECLRSLAFYLGCFLNFEYGVYVMRPHDLDGLILDAGNPPE